MSGVYVKFSCQNEKVVGESVDVSNNVFVHFSVCSKGQDAAFGAAAHCAAYVALACGLGACGENEEAQWRKRGVCLVDSPFHCFNHFGCHYALLAQFGLRGVGGEVRTYGEEVALHLGEPFFQFGVVSERHEQSDVRIELVDSAVRFEALVRFGHSDASNEACHAFVACLGVYVTFFH